MSRSTRLALIVTALWMTLGISRAGAENITFDYSWKATPGSAISSGTGSVLFSTFSQTGASVALGGTTVIDAANVSSNSSGGIAPVSVLPFADVYNHDFGLELSLTDTASGLSGMLTFSGKLVGELTSTESTVDATFSSPLTQTLTLGGHVYEVTIDPTTARIPPPGSTAATLIDAFVGVTAQNNNGGPVTSTTPEPSALALCAAAGAAYLVRRRLRKGGAAC